MPPHHPGTASSIQSSRASSINSTTRRRSEQHLRPEDAFYHSSPPRKSSLARSDTITSIATAGSNPSHPRQRSSREKRRGRSSSRRRASAIPNTKATNGQWKKLLWVKQSYPDNYTDEETFLDHLQRNPRLRPYEFWPLVADSTIIVQHVCSVVIFVSCFSGIIQDKVGPQTVVGWATVCTVAGWVFRDVWQSREGAEADGEGVEGEDGASSPIDGRPSGEVDDNTSSGLSAEAEADFGMPFKEPLTSGTSLTAAPSRSQSHSRNPSSASTTTTGTTFSLPPPGQPTITLPPYIPPYNFKTSTFSPRMLERLTTAKSAILIYCSLLGLSPILRTLTLSTSSDSIWALSSWLLILNIFTFDYGAGPQSKFPASLSTNAALMASTVLASRLRNTTQVFSLTLFSIEVFGLFPVFRRHLRHYSWTGHVWLTVVLVLLASGGLTWTISGGSPKIGILGLLLGVVLGGIVCGLIMGMTSWWLIGLQRYKNEIHGPWDPARPVIRRQWQ